VIDGGSEQLVSTSATYFSSFREDAAEYKFEPTRFDLIVLFYHLDRNLFPKMVSALKPGGLLICKMSLQWDPDGGLAGVSANPLGRNELPSLAPELHVLYQEERPVRDRGVVEFIGRKSGDPAGDELHSCDQCNGPANSTSVSRLRPVRLFEVRSDQTNKIFCQFCSRH
jgi:SAM-dependent methyltransferase